MIFNNVYSLPLDVEEIATQNNWILMDYDNNINLVQALDMQKKYTNSAGFTCIFENQIIIVYKILENKGRQLFTIAHEFGHITLLHLDKLTSAEYEREANMFAARILMPMCVLRECNALSAANISKLCGTSLQASKYRADRLQMLMSRGKFYTSQLERKLLIQLKEFINIENTKE